MDLDYDRVGTGSQAESLGIGLPGGLGVWQSESQAGGREETCQIALRRRIRAISFRRAQATRQDPPGSRDLASFVPAYRSIGPADRISAKPPLRRNSPTSTTERGATFSYAMSTSRSSRPRSVSTHRRRSRPSASAARSGLLPGGPTSVSRHGLRHSGRTSRASTSACASSPGQRPRCRWRADRRPGSIGLKTASYDHGGTRACAPD
jgi:hypothetical protein